MFNRRINFRRARRLFQAAPVEWALALLLTGGFAAIAWMDNPCPDLLGTLMWGMALAIPPVAFFTGLHRAGRINTLVRGIGSVGSLIAGFAAGGEVMHATADAEVAFGFLSASLFTLVILPSIAAPDTGASSRSRGSWRRSIRLFLRLAFTVGFAGWISLLVGFLAGAFATSWGELVGIAFFFLTFASTTVIGITTVLSVAFANYEAFDAPLSGAELLLTKTGFILASGTSILGTLALYTVRATTAGTSISVEVASMQGSLLIGLAIVGPVALFVGSPFVALERDIRAKHSFTVGLLMRLFAPSYVALVAWCAPTVITRWAEYGWTSDEMAGAIVITTGFAYAGLRSAFDALGRCLPNWVIPVVYTAGAIVFASVHL